MYSYEKLKKEHGNPVSQTIDGPILFLDKFDLWDVGLALMIITIFGVILYSWWVMLFLLALSLGVMPVVKRNNNRGVFLHWFYRKCGVSLPGLFNPKYRRRVSD